ncbi:NPP1-like protein [Phytophthora palmivora]|uniref:NPP1-like protein n=1 Tax=Phytophthora palmivora TaxID=4796 RepID=A0A2P4YJJ6_9STRA|nr:NPP1-like protein [Phytophthora palmivora]
MTRFIFLVVTAIVACVQAKVTFINHDQVQPFAQLEPTTNSEQAAIRFKPQVYIKRGCHAYPAVNANGSLSGGLAWSGPEDGDCKGSKLGSQVYSRSASYKNKWAIMYAWYFPKSFNYIWKFNYGQRHYWKFVVVWIDDPSLENPRILGVSMPSYIYDMKETPPKAKGVFKLTKKNGEKQDLITWEQLTDEAREALSEFELNVEKDEKKFAQVPFKDEIKSKQPPRTFPNLYVLVSLMTEPSSTPGGAQSVVSDLDNLSTDLAPSLTSSGAGKRSATEAFEGDSVEDLKDNETTLDDVLVSPMTKKSKLLDEELPDVDDNEEFPQQDEDLDADLALGLENGQDLDENSLNMATENQDMEDENLNMEQDVDDLAPEEEAEDSEPPTSQNNEIDIVDVDEDEEEEEDAVGDFEEDNEDEMEVDRAIGRAQNQREARQLLQQLDDSARSKLCLTALEKYGEELFFGHEDARDAILVDACAQDSVLSLMRDAIRVRDLYLRGSSAAAPVELDDDDDEDEAEGYEGGEEDEEVDEDEEKPAASTESNDDDIVVISEEEEEDDEEADSEAPNSGSEGQTGDASHANESDENVDTQPVNDADDYKGSDGDELEEETNEGDDSGLVDVGAAGDSVSEAPVADKTT